MKTLDVIGEIAIWFAVICFLPLYLVLLLLGWFCQKCIELYRDAHDDPRAEIEADYHSARRAMNVAANQSWRNLVD